jgi:hypothetical protein
MNISKTIEPKSDQLNADDLISGTKIITITEVKESSSEQQPVIIHFKGDNGKPYKPCKSMRRVLVQLWGADASKYAGKSIELFRDDAVKFAGEKVGGIRISKLSHIEAETEVLVTIARGKRKPFTIGKLSEPKKEQLTELHPLFERVKKAFNAGKYTMEEIKDKFIISSDIEKLLTSKN